MSNKFFYILVTLVFPFTAQSSDLVDLSLKDLDSISVSDHRPASLISVENRRYTEDGHPASDHLIGKFFFIVPRVSLGGQSCRPTVSSETLNGQIGFRIRTTQNCFDALKDAKSKTEDWQIEKNAELIYADLPSNPENEDLFIHSGSPLLNANISALNRLTSDKIEKSRYYFSPAASDQERLENLLKDISICVPENESDIASNDLDSIIRTHRLTEAMIDELDSKYQDQSEFQNIHTRAIQTLSTLSDAIETAEKLDQKEAKEQESKKQILSLAKVGHDATNFSERNSVLERLLDLLGKSNESKEAISAAATNIITRLHEDLTGGEHLEALEMINRWRSTGSADVNADKLHTARIKIYTSAIKDSSLDSFELSEIYEFSKSNSSDENIKKKKDEINQVVLFSAARLIQSLPAEERIDTAKDLVSWSSDASEGFQSDVQTLLARSLFTTEEPSAENDSALLKELSSLNKGDHPDISQDQLYQIFNGSIRSAIETGRQKDGTLSLDAYERIQNIFLTGRTELNLSEKDSIQNEADFRAFRTGHLTTLMQSGNSSFWSNYSEYREKTQNELTSINARKEPEKYQAKLMELKSIDDLNKQQLANLPSLLNTSPELFWENFNSAKQTLEAFASNPGPYASIRDDFNKLMQMGNQAIQAQSAQKRAEAIRAAASKSRSAASAPQIRIQAPQTTGNPGGMTAQPNGSSTSSSVFNGVVLPGI